MLVSYRLSIVTIALAQTIRPQFAIECLRRSHQQGCVTLGQNWYTIQYNTIQYSFNKSWQNATPEEGPEGLTDVSQILIRSGETGLSYAKMVSISSAVWAQCTNVTAQNDNIDANRRNLLKTGRPTDRRGNDCIFWCFLSMQLWCLRVRVAV